MPSSRLRRPCRDSSNTGSCRCSRRHSPSARRCRRSRTRSHSQDRCAWRSSLSASAIEPRAHGAAPPDRQPPLIRRRHSDRAAHAGARPAVRRPSDSAGSSPRPHPRLGSPSHSRDTRADQDRSRRTGTRAALGTPRPQAPGSGGDSAGSEPLTSPSAFWRGRSSHAPSIPRRDRVRVAAEESAVQTARWLRASSDR